MKDRFNTTPVAVGVATSVIMFICGVALAWLGFLQATLTSSIFPGFVLGSASIVFGFLGLLLLGKTITTRHQKPDGA